ncbi:Lrrc56 [Symbiodinium sp. CCMP2592]|nr:Lrrc56 [Symbiodinium sp. CCMP2592]
MANPFASAADEESGTNPFSTDLQASPPEQADAVQPRPDDSAPEASKNPFAEGSNAAAEAAPHQDDGDVSLPKEFSTHSVESSQVDATHRQSMFQNAEACAVCGSWLGKRWMRPRHHCRMCNLSVCAACSPSMIVTKGDAGLQRVCNPCVTAMQEAADLKERVFALADALDGITGEDDPGKEEDNSGEAKKSVQQGFLACEASVSKLEDLRRRHEVAFTQVGVLKKELQEAAKSREDDARKRAALESEFQAKSRNEEQQRSRLEAQAREERQRRACVEEELQELRLEKSKLQEELRNVADVAKGSLETSMPARHVGGASTPSSQSVIGDPLGRPEPAAEGPAQENCSDNCKNRCNLM